MTNDHAMLGSGDLPIEMAHERSIPSGVGLADAIESRVRMIEQRAQRRSGSFWARQRELPFEKTDVAYLVRTVRGLLLILAAEQILVGDLARQQ